MEVPLLSIPPTDYKGALCVEANGGGMYGSRNRDALFLHLSEQPSALVVPAVSVSRSYGAVLLVYDE